MFAKFSTNQDKSQLWLSNPGFHVLWIRSKSQPGFLSWKTFFKGEVKRRLIASFQPVQGGKDDDGDGDDNDDGDGDDNDNDNGDGNRDGNGDADDKKQAPKP